MQGKTDICIGVFLVLLISWMLWEAQDWPARTRFFPWAIGFPVLALSAIQLGVSVWRSLRPQTDTNDGGEGHEPTATSPLEAQLLRQRTFAISGWAVVFALGLWLFGFKLGGLLIAPAFLRFQAHESWTTSILYGLGVYLFFFAGLEMALAFPLPHGLLASSLGLQSLDSYLVNPILSLFGY